MIKNYYTSGNLIDPKAIVLCFHGYGSSGENMKFGIENISNRLPNVLFICPDAPYALEKPTEKQAHKMGFTVEFEENEPRRYQWFSLINRSDQGEIAKLLVDMEVMIYDFVDQICKKFSVTHDSIILSGFSQGGCLSVHCGLTMQNKIAGVLSCAGWLNKIAISNKNIRKDIPFIFIHGADDDIVPLIAAEMSVDALQKMSIEAKLIPVPNLKHEMNLEADRMVVDALSSIINK